MFNVRIASAFAIVAIATSLAAPAHAAPPPGHGGIYQWLASLSVCEHAQRWVTYADGSKQWFPALECTPPGAGNP